MTSQWMDVPFCGPYIGPARSMFLKYINYCVLDRQNPATSAWCTMGTTATASNGARLQRKLKYTHDSLAI